MWKFKVSAEKIVIYLFSKLKDKLSSSAFKVLIGIERVGDRISDAPNVIWILHFLRNWKTKPSQNLKYMFY